MRYLHLRATPAALLCALASPAAAQQAPVAPPAQAPSAQSGQAAQATALPMPAPMPAPAAASTSIAPKPPRTAPTRARPKPITITIGLGAQYDSNISVDDADFSVRKGDGSALVNAGVAVTPIATRHTTLRLFYNYDEARNFSLTDYDLTVHAAGAGISQRLGKLTASVDYQYSHVLLGDEAYLDMHMVSPALSGFATPHLFVRAAVTYLRKGFVRTDRLDANTTMVGLDAYRFFAKRKGYLAVGFRADDEWTTGAEFRYGAWQASARAQVPFRLFGAEMKGRLGYTFQRRDYGEITPSIGEKRRETRSTFSAAIDLPITRQLTLRPSFRYIDRHSNVALYDYRERMASTMLVWKI